MVNTCELYWTRVQINDFYNGEIEQLITIKLLCVELNKASSETVHKMVHKAAQNGTTMTWRFKF